MKVLVVDDSPLVGDLIENALVLKGIKNVDKVYNSEEALKKIWEEDYDIYIFDYHLSFMNGLELAEIVKKKGKEKIIIITGDKKFKTEKFTVFYKPFRVEELCEYILK